MRVSRGRLTALWLLLRTLDQLGGEAPEAELLRVALRSGLRAGALPVRDGLVLAKTGLFVVESGGVVSLAPSGRHALELSEEDEPDSKLLRLFLGALLFREPPLWVAWWQGSPDDLAVVLPAEERKVLTAAGLFPPPASSDPLGWAWWEVLRRAPRPDSGSDLRKEIGDAGEELTVVYERERLARQGYSELSEDVAWLARENDAYGFDVLSHAGDDFEGLAPEEPIAIEVKSTALSDRGGFQLFLSAHEWNVARELAPRAVLHLWSGVRPGTPPSAASAEPTVLSPAVLEDHLPGPPACGAECRWESARVVLEL